ncbi:hypothetical protein [Kaistia sp. MMO-174]|uniref:hypothetical protein n=1 Tax=Kaistia sp. MMO-174 TaxID=3081256 RepID=UPI001ACE22D2|nr:hypothetical protein [Hyphomicrobiales bacterium]
MAFDLISCFFVSADRMVRLFDCFLLFNELDLLEIRLHEMAPFVDRFVIAEATTTFSGQPKPLHFELNRARFKAFEDKIVYIVVDTSGGQEDGWARRRKQCDGLLDGVRDAAPDDIVLLSDLDEILSAETLRRLRAEPPRAREVLCFELRMFNYFLNLELDAFWLRSGPRAVRRADLRTMERLRKVYGPSPSWRHDIPRAIKASLQMRQIVRRRVVRNAGWHFSYLGGIDAIRRKLKSYAAHNTVPEDYLNSDKLERLLSAGIAISDMGSRRLFHRDLDESFPAYVRENQALFAHLIAPPLETRPAPARAQRVALGAA